MVRFSQNYGAHISQEYGASSYVNYDKLKKCIHEIEDSRLTAREHTQDSASPPITIPVFEPLLMEEFQRLEEFYNSKVSDMDYHLVEVKIASKSIQEYGKADKWKRKAEEAALKRLSTMLYQKLTRLDTFRLLNRTAIIKILKKHDKVMKQFGDEPVFEHYMDIVKTFGFGHGNRVRELMQQVEVVYADAFCGGVLEEAYGKLSLAKGNTDPRSMLLVAFKIGALMMLVLWFVYNLILSPYITDQYFAMEDPAVYVYAVTAALITYRWFWGFAVYMFEKVDIDYILLLDLDANKHAPSYDQLFSEAANFSILFFINVMIFHMLRIFYDESRGGFIGFLMQHAYILPITLIIGNALFIIRSATLPTSYGVFSTKVFTNLLSSPFAAVHFRHTFAADILTSFTKVFASAAYATCYFISGTYKYAIDPSQEISADRFATCDSTSMHIIVTILYVIPLYMRFMQNMRQQYESVRRRLKVVPVKQKGKTVVVGKKNEVESKASESTVPRPGRVNALNTVTSRKTGAAKNTNDPEMGVMSMIRSRLTGARNDDDEEEEVVPVNRTLSRSESVDLPEPGFFALFKEKYLPTCPRWLKHILSICFVWPYTYNAFKYFLNMNVVIWGALHPEPGAAGYHSYMIFYLFLIVFSTLYHYYWDVVNDWGLMSMKGEHPLLREKLYYEHNINFYYIVMASNFVFRCFWTLSFTPYGQHSFLVVFEIMRRSLWSCLRMELAYIQELNRRKFVV